MRMDDRQSISIVNSVARRKARIRVRSTWEPHAPDARGECFSNKVEKTAAPKYSQNPTAQRDLFRECNKTRSAREFSLLPAKVDFYDNGRLARVLEAQSFVEKDPLALDVGASAHEKNAQLGSVVLAAGRRVKPEKKFATGLEVLLQIAQKKIPFRRPPESLRRMIEIKTNREGRDPIEFLFEMGYQLEGFNRPNDALHSKKIEQICVKRHLEGVQAQHGMAERFQDKEKKSSAAAEIEHVFWPGAMEF